MQEKSFAEAIHHIDSPIVLLEMSWPEQAIVLGALVEAPAPDWRDADVKQRKQLNVLCMFPRDFTGLVTTIPPVRSQARDEATQ